MAYLSAVAGLSLPGSHQWLVATVPPLPYSFRAVVAVVVALVPVGPVGLRSAGLRVVAADLGFLVGLGLLVVLVGPAVVVADPGLAVRSLGFRVAAVVGPPSASEPSRDYAWYHRR